MTFANVITMPAFTTGGQQGVIAEDRHPRRAGAQEGAPSSKKIFNLVFVFQDFWFGRRPFIGEFTAVIVTRWNTNSCAFE